MPGSAAAIAAHLRRLLEHLSYLSRATEVIDETPPEELETLLNGGVNPHAGPYYADLLTRERALPDDATILDLGCGYGRIARHLAPRLTGTQRYVGLDPHHEAVDWARRHLTPHQPRATFERIDIASLAYNPGGTIAGAQYRFPFDDHSLDRILMISVLTHVDLATVRTYVHEAARTLKPESGRLIATLFLLDPTVDALIAAGRTHHHTFPVDHGDGSRVENPDNPELAIAHQRDAVVEIFEAAGLPQVEIREGNWNGRPDAGLSNYQDLVVADLGLAAGSTPGADQGEDADVAGLADALAASGLTQPVLTDFLLWATTVTVNLVWWQTSGIVLVGTADEHEDEEDDGRDPFAATHALGLAATVPDRAVNGGYTPLAEAAIAAAVAATPSASERSVLLDFLSEVTAHGLRVRRAQQQGRRLRLLMPGGWERGAAIPDFTEGSSR